MNDIQGPLQYTRERIKLSLSKVYKFQEINPHVLDSPSMGSKCQALFIERIFVVWFKHPIVQSSYSTNSTHYYIKLAFVPNIRNFLISMGIYSKSQIYMYIMCGHQGTFVIQQMKLQYIPTSLSKVGTTCPLCLKNSRTLGMLLNPR